MPHTTVVSTSELAGHLSDPDWAVIDCRFALNDTEYGRRGYLAAHIPGAIYAHLDEDLSGAVVPGKTGRHPLPQVDVMTRTLSGWGIDANVQVVAYDDAGGSMAAVRLWWLLRWLGHGGVAVLDGGLPLWQRQGREMRGGRESRAARGFVPHLRPHLVADVADVLAMLNDSAHRVIDSRAAERYRGEVEPIDPVAGHIPGAVCAPHTGNLDADERFLPSEVLRARFRALLGDVPAERAVFYCGSGVTAVHNLLALAHAGLGDARLYAGSWSEWITDTRRPVATGGE